MIKKKVYLGVIGLIVLALWYIKVDFSGLSGRPQGSPIFPVLHSKPDVWTVLTTDYKAPMAGLAIRDMADVVTGAILRYQSLPSVKPVWKMFGGKEFHPALLKPDRGVIAAERFQIGEPLICIVPRESVGAALTTMYFSRDILQGSLVIAAIRWGDSIWEDAIHLHELLHYVRWMQKAPSSMSKTGSKLFATEEAEAHSLESDVLDAATQGRYHKALMAAFDSCQTSNLWQTIKDCAPLIAKGVDPLFSESVDSEKSLRAAQYEIELARLWYEKRGSGSPAVDAYMAVTTTSPGSR